jgi:hypothetical protein
VYGPRLANNALVQVRAQMNKSAAANRIKITRRHETGFQN